MELIDDEQLGNEANKNKKKEKKLLIAIIITTVVLIAIMGALGFLMLEKEKNTLKLKIDGVQKIDFAQDLIVVEEDSVYINAKELAEMLGYKIFDGEYKKYIEDKTSCYIQNENEISGFISNLNEIYKVENEKNDYQYYKIEKKVKLINNKVYVPLEGLGIGFNVSAKFENNTLDIYTVQNLAKSYVQKYTTAKIEELNDMKTILYGYLIVEDENKFQGIIDLQGKKVVGNKYTDIEFVAEMEEFFVTTEEGTVGVIDIEGNIKISPKYDSIKIIDSELSLYLVESQRKFGMIDKKGDVIIYLEYEQIGLSDVSKFNNQNIKNSYILFEKCVPVKKDGKWGMLNTSGEQILPIEYDDIGCTNSKVTGTDTVLSIEEIQGIIVKKQEYFGIVDVNGTIIIPTALTAVYSITTNGQTTYKMEYQGQTLDIMEYLNANKTSSNTDTEEEDNQSVTDNSNE